MAIRKPARTPDAREQELIVLAMDVTERQLRDGTVPAPIQTMLVKTGLGRERLERQRLEGEVEMMKSKIAQMESASQSNEKLDAVLNALRKYSGQGEDDVHEDLR